MKSQELINGKMYSKKQIEVWTDGEEVIVPQQSSFSLDDEIEEGHDCDLQGCG